MPKRPTTYALETVMDWLYIVHEDYSYGFQQGSQNRKDDYIQNETEGHWTANYTDTQRLTSH